MVLRFYFVHQPFLKDLSLVEFEDAILLCESL